MALAFKEKSWKWLVKETIKLFVHVWLLVNVAVIRQCNVSSDTYDMYLMCISHGSLVNPVIRS